jgi:hypothetical protein
MTPLHNSQIPKYLGRYFLYYLQYFLGDLRTPILVIGCFSKTSRP